jgi:hypothetical protein
MEWNHRVESQDGIAGQNNGVDLPSRIKGQKHGKDLQGIIMWWNHRVESLTIKISIIDWKPIH